MKSTLSAARAAALAKTPVAIITASERDLGIRFSLFDEMQSCESRSPRMALRVGVRRAHDRHFRKTSKAKTVPKRGYFSFPRPVEDLSMPRIIMRGRQQA